jgi:hypothetical protein
VGAGILDPRTVERLLDGVVATPMSLPAEVV